jgi:excinuclease ABC subunit A
MSKRAAAPRPPAIEIRGARQNNLKGVDLDLPLNQLIVVTGPSGSGKSSLAFQTVYAEGQRRYVETFSPYVRQFFDRMDKPQADEIRGIPPAIAIEQANHVKTTRSTVGTITEINDYLKLLFPRVAVGHCPDCGGPVQPDSAAAVAKAAKARWGDAPVLVTFGVGAPPGTAPAEFFAFLRSQGYLRVLVFGTVFRTDEPESFARAVPARVDVIQDRLPANRRARLLEAVETAFRFGKGRVALIDPDSGERLDFSSSWHCARCDTAIRPPTPGLFSFNHALGACRACRGFGRVIGVDYRRALPDPSLSIGAGVVKAFQGETYQECQIDLERNARRRGLDLDTPFEDLPQADQDWVIQGEGGDPEDAYQRGRWYGVKGFFDWLETKTYKMHVRVFLSRFRSYTECRACGGSRLQPESLNYRVAGLRLPELWRLPVSELLPWVRRLPLPPGDDSAKLLRDEIASRLGYLEEVGLGYLDLDRSTRTLSGGEIQRVNLTTCLGASLTNTLFVLDEPSIGLHPRDIGRLIGVLERLRDKGNTLLVVEHEEAVIRAADHLVDVGPGRGDDGGSIVFNGPAARLATARGVSSLTRDYLTGAKSIPVPTTRRPVRHRLRLLGARQHNLRKIDVDIPLGVLCCVTGVSGSGKSTLVHHVLYENLLRAKGGSSENEPGRLKELRGADQIRHVVLVDQSPLSRTPRSTPALFIGVFDAIRKLFAATEDARSRGFPPGFFSFNAGAGRCERCGGNGFEKVEMQFLSDVFVRCPECEGTRYTREALEVKLGGCSVHDVLEMTVDRALGFFASLEDAKPPREIAASLTLLRDVGLGYLRLGQPLNTLSGGESQRLKLVGHLQEGLHRASSPPGGKAPAKAHTNLLIFDEPTTGLHFDDIAMLLQVFHRLVDQGESLLVIEHNVDVIRSADWILDLGPEAGAAGGQLVAQGTPEQIAAVPGSHTGAALRGLPSSAPSRARETPEASRLPAPSPGTISITGAREHNLKDISLEIPRDQFVVLSGLSGSGKSTLAFDILFAEGQRRFLDSMSAYARQFVEQMEKPDVDHVTGLPPTVAIEQRISRGGGKSTVATVTEIYHFLRLLFAKTGVQHSPATGKPVIAQSVTEIVSRLRDAAKAGSILVLAPLVKARKGFHTEVAEWAGRHGYDTLLVDGALQPVAGFQRLERFKEHTIDVVVGTVSATTPLAETRALAETALKLGKHTARYLDAAKRLHVVSTRLSCPDSGLSFEELDPRLFSYNSPHGWCPECRGYGHVLRHGPALPEGESPAESVLEAELREERQHLHADPEDLVPCPACAGARLNPVARHVKVQGHSIDAIARLAVRDARDVIGSLRFSGEQALITRDILPEILQRLRFLDEVGLGYLQLDRSALTLSGGESQRIRLAAQLGSNLRGVLYVLDEPTIGLHPRDNVKLLDTLAALRDHGNSLLVVEHDEETLRRADHLIDLGPGAGRLGGRVAYQGSYQALLDAPPGAHPDSPTAAILSHPLVHPIRGQRRPLPATDAPEGWIRVTGARANNLKDLALGIPLGRFTGICGISGSGKSSFLRSVLLPAVRSRLDRGAVIPSRITWDTITGAEHIGAIYEVDQSPIGKTSRSTPGTYVKVLDDIRKLYAQVPDARARGYDPGRFSFNTAGGRCETCQGNGSIKLEMNFLPSAHVPCDDCQGQRYNPATLEILYQGKSIAEVLEMTIDEAAAFFQPNPRIARTLELLRDTGLGYLQLGQPSPTLSGGEAQRIKLVSELTRGVGRAQTALLRQNRAEKSHLYLIEEPSIGLHKADVVRLLDVLHRLVDGGATVVVIEHNLEILAEADFLLEIGPEAGAEGGQLVASGTPETVAKSKKSRTAPFLREILGLR